MVTSHTSHTDRLSGKAEDRALTTADLNRFSRAFVASLESNKLEGEAFPKQLTHELVHEFNEELPHFIHTSGKGAPKTRDDMAKIAERVKQNILTNMDAGKYHYMVSTSAAPVEDRDSIVRSLSKPTRSHASDINSILTQDKEAHHEPYMKGFNDKAMIEAAFQAATDALKSTPKQAAAAELKVEDITRFGDTVLSRSDDQRAASAVMNYLSRVSPDLVSVDGNLPESKQDFKALLNDVKSWALDRTMAGPAGRKAPKPNVIKLRGLQEDTSLDYERLKKEAEALEVKIVARTAQDPKISITHPGFRRLVEEIHSTEDEIRPEAANAKQQGVNTVPDTRQSLENAIDMALKNLASPQKDSGHTKSERRL